jgi:hypothetical protein
MKTALSLFILPYLRAPVCGWNFRQLTIASKLLQQAEPRNHPSLRSFRQSKSFSCTHFAIQSPFNYLCTTAGVKNAASLLLFMLTFNRNYVGLAILIFAIEVVIALYVRDSFVRPYLGDVLVVILIYCFIRSFLRIPVLPLAIGVLIFSFTIEFLQYLRLVEWLGLGKSKIARTIIGSSFSWFDILSYAAGIAIVLLVEKYALRKTLSLRAD